MDHNYTHFGARSRGLHLRYTRLRTSSYENARGFTTDLGPAFGQVGLVPIASGLTDWGTMTNFMDPSLCLQSQGLGFTGREQRFVRPLIRLVDDPLNTLHCTAAAEIPARRDGVSKPRIT